MIGIKALKVIKEKNPNMQIILLIGHATVEKTVETMIAGAMDLMEKPADLAALAYKVKYAHDQKTLTIARKDHSRVIDLPKKFGMQRRGIGNSHS